MKMRILSMLLAFAMLFGMMPAVAFAEETEPTEVTVPVEATESALPMQTDYLSAVHVNPLYADVIDDSEVEYFFHKNEVFYSGAEAIADDKVYHTDLSEVVPEFREFMEQRGEVFTFSYIIPIENFTKDYLGELLGELIEAASAHTGVPTQGDYIKWHYKMGSIGASGKQYSGAEVINADVTIQMQYYSTAAQEAAVTSRVNSLLAELNPTGTDYQKIKTVYDWMCANIDYDYDNLNDPEYYLKYCAYAALINGTSVCQGYANLLYRLALEMGIDCRVITGYSANGSGQPEAHAWNIVKLGDSYYNLDATWDSSYAQVGLAYPYFLRSEASFENHYRNSDYTSSAFNAKYPMGESDFDPSQDVVEDDNIIASGTCGENLTWTLDKEGTLTVSGTGAMENYREGYKQTDSPWYEYRNAVTNVVIENGVTTIGSSAFHYCSSLTSIVLPDSVISINGYAFTSCSSLTSITIPAGVTIIGDYAFYYCNNLTSVTMHDGVTSIGVRAFSNCTSLTSITIPDGVTIIGDYAFCYCTNLTSIEIPNSVTVIGNNAFYNCSKLKHITFEGDAPAIDEDAFEKVTATISYPCGKETWSADVMQNYGGTIKWVLRHAEYIDGICSACHEAQIRDSGKCGEDVTWKLDVFGTLTISGSGNMTSCPWRKNYSDAIKYVVIESGVTNIVEYAFYYCTNLTHIEIPNSVTLIDDHAFYHCSSLANIEIPDSVGNIEWAAFYECSSLTSIEIPDSVTIIGSEAFADCTSLTNVRLSNILTRIASETFRGCSNLSKIELSNGITKIGWRAFSGCKSLTDITIPDGVTDIGESAFSGCGLTSVTIPNSVTSIGASAFMGCTDLTSIDISDSVTTIGDDTFWCCQSLTSITIPASVTSIGNLVFNDCARLTSITFEGDAPAFGSNVFSGVEATAYYPADNATWTNEVMENYGGEITWKPRCKSHTWDTGVVTTEPTEETTGIMTYTCTRCGETKTETIPVLEHTHKHTAAITAPNCTEKGYTTYTCACGDTYVAHEVPALNHDLGDWVIIDATCTVDGSKTRACQREGCDYTETEVIVAPGHSHVPEVTAPTCTEKGYTTYTCPCGDSYTADEVAALNHDHAYALTAAPTERASGKLTGICAHCGDEVSVTLPKLNEDDYTYEVELEPTEETDGIAHYVWKNTDYGVYSFDVVLSKLAAALGDVSGDGEINVLDLMYLANYFAKGETINKENADVNKDGNLDVRDLMFLANVFAGKETLS